MADGRRACSSSGLRGPRPLFPSFLRQMGIFRLRQHRGGFCRRLCPSRLLRERTCNGKVVHPEVSAPDSWRHLCGVPLSASAIESTTKSGVQPLYIKGKIAAKRITCAAFGRLGISTFGEELILQVRRRLTSRGKIKHQWRQSLDEL